MCPADQLQPIRLVELLGDVLTERVAGTTRRNTPTHSVVRVRPEQVANRALVRHLLLSIESLDLVKCIYAGRESTVQAENFIGYDSCQRQIVEQLDEHPPNIRMAIFAQTLIIEAVNLSDLARLVVAAQNRDAVRIAHLQRNEKGDRLDTVMTTVNIISHEQIIGVRKTAAQAEKF